MIKHKTAKDRLRRALRRISQWCRSHRHQPVAWQQAQLARKLQGHYAYYGIKSNYEALSRYFFQVECLWRKCLDRESHSARMTGERFARLLKHHPLPRPRIVHRALRA